MAAVAKADLVLHDGAVLGHPDSDSLAVTGGEITAYGRFAALKEYIGPRTSLLPLQGRAIAPGFIDSHLHFMEAAAVAAGNSVQRCRTITELLADLRIAAGRTPPGNWLRAFGCDESLIYDRRGPTRAELDHSTPKNPLRLRHQTLHASWLNSRAIALLGLEKPQFQPPPGAVLVREADGRLSGLVIGMEEWLSARIGRVTSADAEARARVFSRELAAAGVTSITDATVRNTAEDLAALERLVLSGVIVQRTAAMAGPHNLPALHEITQRLKGAVRFAGIKFTGVERWTPPQLAGAVATALRDQLDCAFHCTEVEELDAALTAIEDARPRVPESAARCRIEHGGMIPLNFLGRLAAAAPWVVTNPGFIHYRGAKYAGEPGLLPFYYRARSLLDAGLRMAAASDAPVTPPKPLLALSAAVSRTSQEGYAIAPDEALSAREAFAQWTSAAAELARLNAGVIAPGALADLIVLPADPLSLPPADLARLPVDVTIINGRVVYERGRPLNRNQEGAA